jgi:hypothetical protein
VSCRTKIEHIYIKRQKLLPILELMDAQSLPTERIYIDEPFEPNWEQHNCAELRAFYATIEIHGEECYWLQPLRLLPPEALSLIDWCADYLIYAQKQSDVFADEEEAAGIECYEELILARTGDDHSLAFFVMAFFGVHVCDESNEAVIRLLEDYCLIEWGVAMHCAWFSRRPDNPYLDRVLTATRAAAIETSLGIPPQPLLFLV